MGSTAECPSCGATVELALMNQHLDTCLASGGAPAASPKATPFFEAAHGVSVEVKEEQLAVLLPEVERHKLVQLLRSAGGSVEAALERHFAKEAQLAASQSPGKGKKRWHAQMQLTGWVSNSNSSSPTIAKRSRTDAASAVAMSDTSGAGDVHASVYDAETDDEEGAQSGAAASRPPAENSDKGSSVRNSQLEYIHVADALKKLTETTKRLEITRILSQLLLAILQASGKSSTGDGHVACDLSHVLSAIYLCSNELAPTHHGVVLKVGGSALCKAIETATGMSRQKISSEYKRLGDLGDVAQTAKRKVRALVCPKPLTIVGVHQALLRISQLSGAGSTKLRQGAIQKLLVACRGEETRFIVRTLTGNMRTGGVGRVLQTAVAHAVAEYLNCKIDPTEAAEVLKQVYSQHPDWKSLLQELLRPGVGFDGLAKACAPQPGVPIKPMLARVTADLSALLRDLQSESFQADFKYDGVRAQIHMAKNGDVSIFSRHLENVTSRFPDVVSATVRAARAASTECLIADAEIVAWDVDRHEILPFQTLSSRPRANVEETGLAVHVRVLFFDLMALNDVSLLDAPFGIRRQLLYSSISVDRDTIGFAEHRIFVPNSDGHDVTSLSEYLHEAFANKCEGLMVKELGIGESDVELDHAEALKWSQNGKDAKATYTPSKRSTAWMKIKKDYVEGLSDTIDVIPVGGWWGNGRKAGWISPFLLAIYDAERGVVQSLCKCMSGFTDAFYREQLEVYKDCMCPDPPTEIEYEGLVPSFWFSDLHVWEIKGAELTLSPNHRAAAGLLAGSERGLSLRFPRFLRVRNDKNFADATSAEQLVEMWKQQQQVGTTVVDTDDEE